MFCFILCFQIKEFRIKNSDGTFTIDSSSGILYTRSTFDRESVPKNIPLVKTLIVEAIDNAPSSLPNTNSGPNTGKIDFMAWSKPNPLGSQRASVKIILGYFLSFHNNNRIYDGVEAETRKSQASFQII